VTTQRKPRSITRLVRVFKKYFAPKNIFTKEDRTFRLNWWQILCVIASSALASWLLASVGRFDLSRPILADLGALFIAIRLRWRLRDRIWFWATIFTFTALSCLLIATLTWTTEGPSRPIVGGFMAVSVYCLFVVLHAFEIRFQEASPDVRQHRLGASHTMSRTKSSPEPADSNP
jgi:hypothetical protein